LAETSAFKVKSTPPHRLSEGYGVGSILHGGGIHPTVGLNSGQGETEMWGLLGPLSLVHLWKLM